MKNDQSIGLVTARQSAPQTPSVERDRQDPENPSKLYQRLETLDAVSLRKKVCDKNHNEKNHWVNLTNFLSLAFVPKNTHIEKSN